MRSCGDPRSPLRRGTATYVGLARASVQLPGRIQVTDRLRLHVVGVMLVAMPLPDDPQALMEWTSADFDRGGGPGGQHRNKVSTRVTLRFSFESCDLLTPFERSRIRTRLARRIGADGTLRVTADSDRSQLANREAARARLHELLSAALHVDAPRTATRPTRGSQRRRVNDKRRRGDVKRDRRGQGGDD